MIYKLINDNEYRELEELLDRLKEKVDVIRLRESRMYTALSFSSFKNHIECFKLIKRHAFRYNIRSPEDDANEGEPELAELLIERKKIIQNWINQTTDEKFTALHFSTYHGNIELIKIIVEEMHGDFLRKNVYGANVLHIAAQGDQPCPLYYFVQLKDMDINEQDNRGSTALHWACYSKAEFALGYILAMGPDLEQVDNNGLTPLHLAVRAVPEF